jgi:hypothetical protein
VTQTDIRGRQQDDEPRSRPPVLDDLAPRPWWRRPWIIPLALVVAGFLYFQVHPFAQAGLDEKMAPIPPHDGFPAYYPLLLTHIVFGTISMIAVVLLVWPRIRLRHPAVHRVSGRIYVIAALVTGVVGLVLIPFAPAIGKVGVVGSTVTWLVVTVAGYRAVRAHRFVQHRRYMLYSFAIVMNNVWGLAIVNAGLAIDPQMDITYLAESARWVGWVGNLALVQWWLYRTANRRIEFAPETLDRIRSRA